MADYDWFDSRPNPGHKKHPDYNLHVWLEANEFSVEYDSGVGTPRIKDLKTCLICGCAVRLGQLHRERCNRD